MYEDIDILEIDSLSTNKNIIDIREKYEYNLGNIFGSINIPYNFLMTNPDIYLNKSNTYYIYCNSGIKSRKLCIYLNEKGFHTIDLIGGYKKYINHKHFDIKY